MKKKQCIVIPRELDEVLSCLPEVKQWDESTIPTTDIFITALGFENRVLHVPKIFANAATQTTINRIPLTVLGRYLTNLSDNSANENPLLFDLNKFSNQIVSLDADAPHSIAQELGIHIDRLINTQETIKVTFDISAASGNFILSVMHTILKRGSSIDLTILYVEPATYFPKRAEYEDNLEGLIQSCCAIGDPNSPHESGVDAVYVNELYPGYSSDNRPELVIAAPSFRTERLLNSLQFVSDQVQADPEGRVLWLIGMPYAEENHWRNDLQCRIIKRMMASMAGFETSATPQSPTLNETNYRNVSTLNYTEMVRAIIDVSDTHLGHKLSLIHMGSKMQAIGLSLALHVREEITVCYARPARFNPTRYSEGCSTCWTIPFGLMSNWTNKLSQIGELALVTTVETSRTGLPTT
jgi:hypothetical protein